MQPPGHRPTQKNSNNERFFTVNKPPNTSSSVTSVVEKSDIVNATTSKHTQLNKKDLRHSNTKLVRNVGCNIIIIITANFTPEVTQCLIKYSISIDLSSL